MGRMPDSTGPADTQGHPDPDHRHPDTQQQLDVEHDVLMPDLRRQAVSQGRDPEEVDPLSDDEDALRLNSLGGSTNLD